MLQGNSLKKGTNQCGIGEGGDHIAAYQSEEFVRETARTEIKLNRFRGKKNLRQRRNRVSA